MRNTARGASRLDPRPVTLSDVAAHAGVSLATASRVINGSTRTVRPELEARVKEAAEHLGYVVDARAQAMALGSAQTVALIVGDISDPYFAGIAAGLTAAAEGLGIMVTLIATGMDPDAEIRAVTALRSQRPRAIVLAGSRRDDPQRGRHLVRELTAYAGRGGRVAFVGSRPVDAPSDGDGSWGVVEVENRKGARDLASALVCRGYRQFVVLTGPVDLATPGERVKGFVEGLGADVAMAVEPTLIASDLTRDGAYGAMQLLLADRIEPETCVFAVTDAMALGALTAIRDHGLVPGQDVAVAGFDDIALLRDVVPSLTTVGISLREIGARALAAALGATDDVGAIDEQVLAGAVAANVHVRDSTPAI